MKMNPIVYGALVVVVFMGIILGFQAAGVWSISGKVGADGQAIQPSAADVNTIKGWMTLAEIETTFKVPHAEILTHFNLPADTVAETAIKDLETETFDVTALKTFLQERSMAPATPASQQPEVKEALPTEASRVAEMVVAPTEHVQPDRTVTGNTTFQDLLDWGVSAATMKGMLGLELPSPETKVKDFATAQGLTFSDLKPKIQSEVDRIK